MKKNVDTLKLRRKLAVFWRRVLRIQTMFSNQNCLVIIILQYVIKNEALVMHETIP